MSDQHRPQRARLARLLKVAPEEVVGLDGVPDADLRLLHDQVGHVLYGDGHERFGRVAALSKVLPGPVAGRLAERFLPAELAARVSEQLDPERAADLVDRVSVDYVADIALALDPQAAAPILERLPPRRIGQVAGVLFGRGEYGAAAEFVSSLSVPALREAVVVATGADLLALLPLVEWDARLDEVIAELGTAQVQRIVTGLQPPELADLALTLGPERLGPIVRALSADTLADVARVLLDRGHPAEVAGFVEQLDDSLVRAVADIATEAELALVEQHLPPELALKLRT